jgi:predicted SprT family Zn-dependent metalloprotease
MTSSAVLLTVNETTATTTIVPEAAAQNQENNAYNFGEDGLTTYNINRRLDENVLRIRRSLYALINKTLKNLIFSPVDLTRFREDMHTQINRGTDTNMSLEMFTEHMFAFFNQRLFFSLLDSVEINWSRRFKSTAASTVLIKNPAPAHIVIRMSYNLLSKLNKIETVKMLLHEMIHSFLGVAIGDFDTKHDSNFKNVLLKIKWIVSLEIPIEHNFNEVLDSVYIWVCNLCKEKRIRFYNKPPTYNQRESHAINCRGSFIMLKEPKR